MKTHRTIIDILRKGNQELFHSSMIAWLLDPQAEHGFCSAFLDGFADLVAQRGNSAMKKSLRTASVSSVATETTTYKGRYDIVLRIGQSSIVIENKTKSLGGKPQFDKYKDKAIVLVALGLTEISFDQDVQASYPVVTYGDVLALLDSIEAPLEDDFGVLVRHYREFLRRELHLVESVDRWATTGSEDVAHDIRRIVAATVGFTTNDKRFLNWCLLERFIGHLRSQPKWKTRQFKTVKNMQSGVWLALFGPTAPPSPYEFNNSVREFCAQNSVGVWFHIELRGGLLTEKDEDMAGVIQLKCHSEKKSSNAKIRDAFRSMWQLEDGESFVKSVKSDSDTFYLVGRSLFRAHLTHSGLEQQLESFMCRFGSFVRE